MGSDNGDDAGGDGDGCVCTLGSNSTCETTDGKVTDSFDPRQLFKYPDSPTAKTILAAYNNYHQACTVMNSYANKPNEIANDQTILRTAFHQYLNGLVKAEFLSKHFKVSNSRLLISTYLELNSDDLVAEYLLCHFCTSTQTGSMNYLSDQHKVQWLSEFSHKLLKSPNTEHNQMLLFIVYHFLGSHYSKSHNDQKAMDYFQRCFDLDMTSLPAMYALGHACRNRDPEKALNLLQTYLNHSPKCDMNYAKCLYTIGLIHFNTHHNNSKAKYYYAKGLEAEGYRLPCFLPEQVDAKDILELFVKSETEINWTVVTYLTMFACISVSLVILF